MKIDRNKENDYRHCFIGDLSTALFGLSLLFLIFFYPLLWVWGGVQSTYNYVTMPSQKKVAYSNIDTLQTLISDWYDGKDDLNAPGFREESQYMPLSFFMNHAFDSRSPRYGLIPNETYSGICVAKGYSVTMHFVQNVVQSGSSGSTEPMLSHF